MELESSTPHRNDGNLSCALIAALAFSGCVSVSVVYERVAHGHAAFGWICAIAVTISSAALIFYSKPLPIKGGVPTILVGHLFGIFAGATLVHVVVIPFVAEHQLVEHPAQLVNDGVLMLALLGLVWSYLARTPLARAILPIPSFLLVCGYAVTRAEWHLDPFSGFGVQSYVVNQVFATAAGLFFYFVLRPDAWRRG
jgi:hypothetical protein